MSLILPKDIPALDILKREGCKVLATSGAQIPTVRILLLNLMPVKPTTELDFARALAPAAEKQDVELLLMKIAGQKYKNTPQEYVEQFYTDFDALTTQSFDGLIVTGAPLENMPFEQVRYWQQLIRIFDWAQTHVRSTLYVCWAAQAALYHFFNIEKQSLDEKMFGIFPQTILQPECPLFKHFTSPFPMPHSRHTEVRQADLKRTEGLTLLSVSKESGAGLAMAHEGREIFVTGHLEYAPDTLDKEYQRDVNKGLHILPPLHYYDSEGKVDFSWHKSCQQFYTNWVNEYVVEDT